MKRFIIAIIITATLLSVNVWSMLDLKKNSTHLIQSIDQIQQALQAQQYDQLEQSVTEFSDNWSEIEYGMSRYIRHNHLETITAVVARLPALVRYKAFYEVSADLDQVRTLLEHLVEFETPPMFGFSTPRDSTGGT